MEISIKWNICRICLQEERVDHPNMKSIFTETRLVKQIVDCAGIELFANDGLPEKICRKCLLTLKYAVSFRNTCRKSDEHLRSVIQKAKEATIIEHAENTLAVEEMDDIIEELDDGGDEYVYVIEKVDDRQGVGSTAAGDTTETEEPQETENSTENDLTTEIKRIIKKEKYNLIDLTRPEEQQGTRNSDNSYSVEIMPADPLTSICVEEDDDDDDDEKFYAEAKNKKKMKQISSKNYEENESKENLDGFFSENEVYTVHETGEVIDKSQIDDSDLSYIKVRISNGSDDEYILGEDESEEIDSSDEGEKVVKKEDGVIVKRAKYSLTDFSEETNRDRYGVCFYCGNTFASDQSLKIHIRNVHKVRTLECE